MRQDGSMSPWFYNVYMDPIIKDKEKRREWRLWDLLYADELLLSGESEGDLRPWWRVLLRYVGGKV